MRHRRPYHIVEVDEGATEWCRREPEKTEERWACEDTRWRVRRVRMDRNMNDEVGSERNREGRGCNGEIERESDSVIFCFYFVLVKMRQKINATLTVVQEMDRIMGVNVSFLILISMLKKEYFNGTSFIH